MARWRPQPARVPFPLPAKRQRVRSEIARAPKRVWLRHRKFVRSHHCVVPGCQALDIEACHIRSAADAGTGLKPPDWRTFPACHNHHAEQHQVGQGTFEDRHGLDLDRIAAELVRRSPDMQMRLAMLEAGENGIDERGRGVSEDQPASPLTQQGAATPDTLRRSGMPDYPRGGPSATLQSRISDPDRCPASLNPARRDQPSYRLAGPTARLCRLLPHRGFVS